MYDPGEDVWHIFWAEPNTRSFERMKGGQQGDDIVQEYRDEEGTLWQWRFTDIAVESFRWLARESRDDGKSWRLRNEFVMKRRTGA